MVVIFEDLHWLDDISSEILDDLIDGIDKHPILTCCVYRPEFHPNWQNSAFNKLIKLKPLNSEECNLLIHNLLPDVELPPFLIEHLIIKSEGNPFYIEEVLRTLIEKDYLELNEEGLYQISNDLERTSIAKLNLPESIQGLIMSRIDYLDTPLKQVLQVASAIGRTFSLNLLKYLTNNNPNLEIILEQLLALNLLILEKNNDDYSFCHLLTQEVAYESLLNSQKRELHNNIAKYYEEKDAGTNRYLELIAFHYDKGKNWQLAIEYLMRSSQKANNLFANNEAIIHLKRANEILEKYLSEEIDSKLKVFYQLAKIHTIIGKKEISLELYQQSLKLAINYRKTIWEAQFLLKIGDWKSKQGLFDEAFEYYKKSLKLYEEKENIEGLARIYINIGVVELFQGQLDEAIKELQKALKYAEKINDKHSLRMIWHNLGMCYEGKNQVEDAIEAYKQSLEYSLQLNHLRGQTATYMTLGIIFLDLNKIEKAEYYIKKSLELSRKTGDIMDQACALTGIGDLQKGYNDLAGAIESYTEAKEIFEQLGYADGLGECYPTLAKLYIEQKNYARALEYAKQARALFIKLEFTKRIQAMDKLISSINENN